MFFLANQLFQLAFSNMLCGIYSILALLVVGYVLYQWLHLRKTQQQWTQQWTRFQEDCHHRIDDVLATHTHLEESLQAHHFTDLVTHLRVFSLPPTASHCAEQMIHTAQSNHALLESSMSPPHSRFVWPLWALGLGLLGTLLGLISWGITESFPVQAQPTSVVWLSLLPKLSATIWPLLCGVWAALFLWLPAHQKQQVVRQRQSHTQRLQQELATRIQRELYPHLATAGLFVAQSPQSQTAVEDSVRLIQDVLEKTQTTQQRFLQDLLEQWHNLWNANTLPDLMETFQQHSTVLQAEVSTWVRQVTEANVSLSTMMDLMNRSFQPIEHTQQLFQERLGLMLRQHESMALGVEKLLAWEETLPEKLRDVVKLSLQPAHRILQNSSQSLHQSIELVLERNVQERALWRNELKQFTERLQILERMSQDTSHVLRELTQITQHLAEIAEHLRFRPRPTAPPDNSSVSLDQEIDQILEDLGHRQSDS